MHLTCTGTTPERERQTRVVLHCLLYRAAWRSAASRASPRVLRRGRVAPRGSVHRACPAAAAAPLLGRRSRAAHSKRCALTAVRGQRSGPRATAGRPCSAPERAGWQPQVTTADQYDGSKVANPLAASCFPRT